ncbi:MAG TPA: hypothetical protein VFD18_05590 [Chthoniobacterales bacterium]|nr:hypothetical protein [Chthoniobacterales bacterium]
MTTIDACAHYLRHRWLQRGWQDYIRKEFLPNEVKCLRFYNPDEIARGLSPLDPRAGAFKAGLLLLNEIRGSLSRRETFALETTLSRKTHLRTFQHH